MSLIRPEVTALFWRGREVIVGGVVVAFGLWLMALGGDVEFQLYETATMNEVGATPKARKPFFFHNSSGAPVPVDALV